jgi:hypothetical protein
VERQQVVDVEQKNMTLMLVAPFEQLVLIEVAAPQLLQCAEIVNLAIDADEFDHQLNN